MIAAETVPTIAGPREVLEKSLSNSSIIKSTPAIGVLKAAARPAPAPLAKALFWCLLFISLATLAPKPAPMCMVGPSRPSDKPEAMPTIAPKNFTITVLSLIVIFGLFRACLTCGMPLPPASLAYF